MPQRLCQHDIVTYSGFKTESRYSTLYYRLLFPLGRVQTTAFQQHNPKIPGISMARLARFCVGVKCLEWLHLDTIFIYSSTYTLYGEMICVLDVTVCMSAKEKEREKWTK